MTEKELNNYLLRFRRWIAPNNQVEFDTLFLSMTEALRPGTIKVNGEEYSYPVVTVASNDLWYVHLSYRGADGKLFCAEEYSYAAERKALQVAIEISERTGARVRRLK